MDKSDLENIICGVFDKYIVETNQISYHTQCNILNELTDKILQHNQLRKITCVYCGYCYPEHVSDTKHPLLYEHIQKCDKHPVGRMIRKIVDLRNNIGNRIGLAAKNDDSQTVSNFCWLVTELDKIIQEP